MPAAIWAAIESIPIVLKLVQQAVDSFQLWQLSRVDAEYSDKSKQRKAILSILTKTVVSDEERKACLRLLWDLKEND